MNEIDANSIGKVSIHPLTFFDYFLKKAKYYCPDAILTHLLILDNQHG